MMMFCHSFDCLVGICGYRYVLLCRAVMGMLTVGNMMSMVTKERVDVTDTIGKVVYRQFKQVWTVNFSIASCRKYFYMLRWIQRKMNSVFFYKCSYYCMASYDAV